MLGKVSRMEKNMQDAFACPNCGMLYFEKHFAEECEKWCAANNSCNLAITSHAATAWGGKRDWNHKKAKGWLGW